jgi:hypothetical protein
MMYSNDEDIELCSIDSKKHKNNQKIRKISLTVRLGSKIYLSSTVSLYFSSV